MVASYKSCFEKKTLGQYANNEVKVLSLPLDIQVHIPQLKDCLTNTHEGFDTSLLLPLTTKE